MKKASKEENESVEAIPEEIKNESVIEQPPEQTDEIVSAPPEQVKPEPKKKEPPIPLDQPVKQNVRQQDKLVKCPQCDKQMKLKSYRYKHELTCKGQTRRHPQKTKSNAKTKSTTHATRRRNRRSNTTTQTKINPTCFKSKYSNPVIH